MNRLIHTPEGVRDYYNQECARNMALGNMIDHLFLSYGYRFIQTPTFEFFDVFNKERGSARSQEMYKFFDNHNDTLVLRPDITPSVARAISKYYLNEDMPLRLAYHGNVFTNAISYRGKLAEMTHLGCELVGDQTTESDAEVISITIEALRQSGLKDFQVEIGNIEFFYGIMEESGFSEEEISDLHDLIENKNYFAIEGLLNQKEIPATLKDVILKLPQMYGSIDKIREFKNLTRNEKAIHAIERLEKIYSLLCAYHMNDHVTFDLGLLSAYKYYTGVVFQAFTFGMGDFIASGGRYDHLVEQFGKNTPAVGCSIKLELLLLALSRQNVTVPTDPEPMLLLYDRSQKKDAIEAASALRNAGHRLTLMRKFDERTMKDYAEYAKRNNITEIFRLAGPGALEKIDPVTGGCRPYSVAELISAKMTELR
ncbi:MAG: ATP phosphoribosyltransferase regulatory subunit [Lachnospiraceae bacterium]|nr:ATP phosphoribosyltransferase regulatory subunit [Lachnospiraceae bacterium]